jgi:CDP-6-deoxy-D-xylo-4-hexulose-3-dehydrase
MLLMRNGADSAAMSCARRKEILNLCEAYFHSRQQSTFVAGETYIPASGKVLDADDLVHLVDASLDMWLTSGRYAVAFEERLATRMGVKHAHLTVSGSAANLLAFTALTSPKLNDRRILPGSEVLTVAAAFPTTVAPVVQNGCVPVFVDVDLETCNVNVDQLAAAVTPKTRAIVLAHTLGNPFDLEGVSAVAKQHGLYLIEDCCDAFGATFDGRGVGTWGDFATLSFYPAHHITMGEGGAVLTRSKSNSRLVESFRDWGRDCWCAPGKENTCGQRFAWQLGDLPFGYDHKYTYTHLGYNLKVTDMQAAIGVSQLAKVDTFIAKRRENFAALTEGFRAAGLEEHLILPQPTRKSCPSWFGYVLTIRDGSPLRRREVVSYLEEHKIGTRLLFGGNLVSQPAFSEVAHRVAAPLQNTDKVMNDTFWIGVWPGIGPPEREYMINVIKQMIRELVK